MDSNGLISAIDAVEWPSQIAIDAQHLSRSAGNLSKVIACASDSLHARAIPPGSGLLPNEIRAEVSFANRLREQIAFLDHDWTLIAVNQAWADATLSETHLPLFPGSNYLSWCKLMAARGDDVARATADALHRIDARAIDRFDQVDPRPSPSGRTYETRIYAFGEPDRQWRTIARYDMSEINDLKQQKRRLGSKLLHAETEERRRIARDLHDTTAQDLTALQLTLANLKRGQRCPIQDEFADADEALERLQREIRGLSYLFHSRWSDEMGFDEALEDMVNGFARRAGLRVRLSVQQTDAVDRRLGLSVHRMVQEALANVQRHAKASLVEVRIVGTQQRLHIIVRDNGCGFALGDTSAKPASVGLGSMRERIEELGGAFKLKSGPQGTAIIASVPLHDGLADRSRSRPESAWQGDRLAG